MTTSYEAGRTVKDIYQEKRNMINVFIILVRSFADQAKDKNLQTKLDRAVAELIRYEKQKLSDSEDVQYQFLYQVLYYHYLCTRVDDTGLLTQTDVYDINSYKSTFPLVQAVE